MDWLNDFLTYAGTEAGERAVNVVLAILAVIGAVLLWMFGIFGKLWGTIFPKPKQDEPETPPTYQMTENARGGFAEAKDAGIATGQVMGDQTINYGAPTGEIRLTLDQLTAQLKKERDETEKKLRTAHDDEKAALTQKITELERRLANPDQALSEARQRIADLEALLERSSDNIGGDRIAEARAALEKGDYSIADDIFAEIEARNELAVQEAARAAYGRGEIAEAEVRWADAAAHYAKAVKLDENYETLRKASEFAERSGDFNGASQFSSRLLLVARKGDDQQQLSTALNEHALNQRALGFYQEAEGLFRDALEIDRATIGERHPDYATRLNNLADVVKNQGRYEEAEGLFRDALEIDRATIGEGHPDYAIRLNNLAGVIADQGRHEEARKLYEEALAIYRSTLPPNHPYIKTTLDHIASLPKP
ncbi:tetratricopeptide repeat protein [Yoonia sp. R2-816]|uniref:tetratricopeptide repeat protein n=1 Tax=Yoonia sp. R2-816 TaxID=3342638 RepID=UPI0037279DB3